jgi:hypothetical protein
VLGQHRYRHLVAVHAIAGEYVSTNNLVDRAQKNGAPTDLVGERRDVLPIERWCCPYFSNRIMASRRLCKPTRQHVERGRSLAR